jgi:hypothetical protein
MSSRKVGVAASALLMKGALGRNAMPPAATAAAPAKTWRRDNDLPVPNVRFDVPFDMPASPCCFELEVSPFAGLPPDKHKLQHNCH